MKKALFYLKVLFIICLFVWIAIKFDYKSARNIIAQANIYWALASIIVTFFTYIFLSLRWKMIIRGFWEKPKSTLTNLISYNLIGVFYTLFLPTSIAGEAVRLWKLSKSEDNDYAKAAFTAIIDRVVGVCMWFVLFIILPSKLPKNKLLLLVLLAPVVLYIFKDKLIYKEKKLFDFSRHHPLDIVYAIIFSFISQIVYIASGYCVLKCFNINLDPLWVGGILSAGALVNLIPVSLLGFGAREGFIIATLPMYGVLPTQAVLITSFFVFLTYLTGVAGGFIELMNAGWKLSSLKKPDIGNLNT